ncbi:hypothetical protein CORC01_03943 [Colletotrichum orchidophilum]|uniref:Uncharacterized protein n=1 Tax=Colletotrichum orchidophilum TaxID=1209926 RepID=A0A1G4BH24_9PEZI|nr:uncharacterized protein CORC01_03943 [Colletotrichum orchidophilum]OHF00626.1 hypothetical protein CORC01_03943 [Colletotrichum orchidophilum]
MIEQGPGFNGEGFSCLVAPAVGSGGGMGDRMVAMVVMVERESVLPRVAFVDFPISGLRQDIWVTQDVDYARHGIADEPDSSNRQSRLAFKLNERSIDPACWENEELRESVHKDVGPVSPRRSTCRIKASPARDELGTAEFCFSDSSSASPPPTPNRESQDPGGRAREKHRIELRWAA